ncbi:MAG: hypothetical protein HY674_23485 [Chloroflexi bacterium]|nr:hypothetical protein [Chloroflexota bacterium]
MNTRKPLLSPSFLAGCLAVLLMCFPAWSAKATPYASSLTNSNGTISFILNESADSVKVIFDGGVRTSDLGALAAGKHSFSLGTATSFRIEVTKIAPAGYLQGTVSQIGADSKQTRFNSPRGVAVNTDPTSPYFGRIYVANSAAGTTSVDARSLGDGIYMVNADLSDAVGQGDAALTGGLDFSASASNPYRLTVGKDNNLYIADWSDATGNLYVTDPNVSNGTGQIVLGGPGGGPPPPLTSSRIHGSIAAAVVEGSLADGNLVAYVIDEDMQDDPDSTALTQLNSLWKHEIGATLPGPFVFPTRITSQGINFVSQTMDLDRGPDGKFYISNYRSAGTDRAGLYVIDTDGTLLWDSLSESRNIDPSSADILKTTGGISVTRKGDYVALVNFENNTVSVVPLVEGIPDLSKRQTFNGFGTTRNGRDLAFDAAGNLYVISVGSGAVLGYQLLKAFSPGGHTIATTGSDGTFTVANVVPQVFVSVSVSDDTAAETGGDTGTFKIAREGDTSSPLTVTVGLSGTATAGVDYEAVPASITIPTGASEATIAITPLDDTVAEFPETVVLTLGASTNYSPRTPISATVTINDTETPAFRVAAGDTNMYERVALDTGSFRLIRLGDVAPEVTVNLSFSGTATEGTDYEPVGASIVIPAGSTNDTVTIAPKDDQDVEGDEMVTLTVAPGATYTVDSPNSASVRIQDDDLPPAPILFEDNFDTDSSANWTIRFGANDGVEDYTALFSYDYSAESIPPAPHSTGDTTLGLFLQVNKTLGTPSSAGINLYPINKTFSGNYALRYDMLLSVGTAATTEHAIAGLNHSGSLTNRATQSADPGNTTAGGDGVWIAIVGDASNLRDYGAYTVISPTSLPTLLTTRAASTLANIFTSPPYSPFAGSPANSSSSGNKTWVDVEISQVSNLISLKVNNTLIFQVTNTTAFTNGTIMLGHNDQYNSVGSPSAFVVYDNVRVVSLEETPQPPSPITITSIQLANNKAQIRFTSTNGVAADFRLESATVLNGPYAPDAAAVITSVSAGVFQAETPVAGAIRFYRIKR